MTDAFTDLHRAIPVRLFTVTAHDMAARLFRRVYTSDAQVYPVSGTKPVTEDAWSRHVIDGGKTFVANRAEDFRALFPDHATITALGCHSAVNIPVKDETGTVAGTVNLLHDEGWFTPERLALYEAEVENRQAGLLAAMRAMGPV